MSYGSYGAYPPAQAHLPAIEGVTIGRTASIDPRVWQRHAGDTFFGLDRADLVITAQGYIQLDQMTHIHRFYTDEEVMLQAGTGAATGGPADDLTIFHGLWSTQPASEWERRQFLDQLRRSRFTYQGVTWDRFWYEGDESDQEPVTIWEAVYEDRSGHPARHVAQTCMLYSRALAAGGHEMLLALETMPEHGVPSQELMVGLPLNRGEFFA
jgi:hypothetical protein